MLDRTLADLALDAAIDFDMLRIGKPDRRNGVERILQTLRKAFALDGNIGPDSVDARDVILLNEVLTVTSASKHTTVLDVITGVNAIIEATETAWKEQIGDEEHTKSFVTFFVTLSKYASARLGSTGHTFVPVSAKATL